MYEPNLALTIVSGVFLLIGALCGTGLALDILTGRQWKSMMAIMVLVWPITAAYGGPLSLYIYYNFGRPNKSEQKSCQNHKSKSVPEDSNVDTEVQHSMPKNLHAFENDNLPNSSTMQARQEGMHHEHHESHSIERPMWVTTLVGVSHCGAGCVLGDLVGEWFVYGTDARIAGRNIWAELLIDYAFALLLGIAFQYFSIAPMSNQWGWQSVYRAAKADILSLTSFELGLFAWMVIFQVGIFDYRLSIDTWVYWWMMQIGMVLGTATAFPVNWFLIRHKIKEPCV